MDVDFAVRWEEEEDVVDVVDIGIVKLGVLLEEGAPLVVRRVGEGGGRDEAPLEVVGDREGVARRGTLWPWPEVTFPVEARLPLLSALTTLRVSLTS